MAGIADQIKCPCCGQENPDPKLLPLLQDLELAQGHKLKINSGFRCEKHHRELGLKGYPTAKNSYHLKGLAADVATEDEEDRAKLISNAQRLGFGGIGVGDSFVHLDLGPKRIWAYR